MADQKTYSELRELFDKEDMSVRDDRVLIYPDPQEKVSAGGIIIPDIAREEPRKGLIVLVGPGSYEDPMPPDLYPGQTVWYGKYAGAEFEFGGLKFMIMREQDVMIKKGRKYENVNVNGSGELGMAK